MLYLHLADGFWSMKGILQFMLLQLGLQKHKQLHLCLWQQLMNTPLQTQVGHEFCCKCEGTLCHFKLVCLEEQGEDMFYISCCSIFDHLTDLNGDASLCL